MLSSRLPATRKVADRPCAGVNLLRHNLETPSKWSIWPILIRECRIIRAKYNYHVTTMLKIAGFSDTEARTSRIVALEHTIAEKHLSIAECEDINKANNTWKR